MAEEARRKHKRYRVSWATRVLFADKRIVSARTKDVSAGGLGFEFGEQIPQGTEINIEINPHVKGKQYQIRAKGVITYNMIMSGNSGFTHGLKFSFIPREHFEDLTEILKGFDQA
jgi:c-di-GMP-binding flagellar brake protein YcgR